MENASLIRNHVLLEPGKLVVQSNSVPNLAGGIIKVLHAGLLPAKPAPVLDVSRVVSRVFTESRETDFLVVDLVEFGEESQGLDPHGASFGGVLGHRDGDVQSLDTAGSDVFLCASRL